jgi:hypothetical protein
LRKLLIGFLRGLLDADQQHQFRRLAICELDPQRFEQIRDGIYQLSGSPLCEDVEITINEVRLPRRWSRPRAGSSRAFASPCS